MTNSKSRESGPPVRRAIYGAILGGLGAALGAIFARPLVDAFRDSAPWVLPVIIFGLVSALTLFGLLLPILLRRRPRQ